MKELHKLSVVIPAHNEEGCVTSTVQHLHLELKLHNIDHEIIVVNDGSTDQTLRVLEEIKKEIPNLRILTKPAPHGFGRAVIYGLDHIEGDAAVIMMADESDSCSDVVEYWNTLNEGYDCVFGSRFIKGGGVIAYPYSKLLLNRLANRFIQIFFGLSLNDTTNAFKAYRKGVIDGCKPLISRHFNLTVELPLKAIVRGYTWKVVPITWHNRKAGESKLKIQEMGSRYLFICLYVWLEKYLSRGDYKKPAN